MAEFDLVADIKRVPVRPEDFMEMKRAGASRGKGCFQFIDIKPWHRVIEPRSRALCIVLAQLVGNNRGSQAF